MEVKNVKIVLTPIGNILGPSPSVIFGNKIQNFFFENFRQLWRHTSQLDSDVICGGKGTSYSVHAWCDVRCVTSSKKDIQGQSEILPKANF